MSFRRFERARDYVGARGVSGYRVEWSGMSVKYLKAGTKSVATALFCLLWFGAPCSSSSEDAVATIRAAPSTETIVQKLVEANARRAQELQSYRGKRIYDLDYHGLFSGHAELQVEVTYVAPNEKDFHILSESGSKLLINHVLLKLLQSEHDAQQEKNRKELEISPANYDFKLESTQRGPNGEFYVLDVSPKNKSKYVYDGKIWVDARDFAVVRMDGSPSKNPSIWVSHIQIQYEWAKIDGFWLPVRNYSVTQVRMGGRAELNISYSDYSVTAAHMPFRPRSVAGGQVLPNPSSVTVDPH